MVEKYTARGNPRLVSLRDSPQTGVRAARHRADAVDRPAGAYLRSAFFACLANRFSSSDLAGFFLSSFLRSIPFDISASWVCDGGVDHTASPAG
jgi:hypothetical protein